MIDAVLDAKLDLGAITEEHLPEEQERLVGLSSEQLQREIEAWCG
jgi:hypothetical protein